MQRIGGNHLFFPGLEYKRRKSYVFATEDRTTTSALLTMFTMKQQVNLNLTIQNLLKKT